LFTGFAVVPIAENGFWFNEQTANVRHHSGIREVLKLVADQRLQCVSVNRHPELYRDLCPTRKLSLATYELPLRIER
jgi:hypothetical protein